MFLLHGEVIFCSWYSSFSIFNYPMIYHISDVMMGISTWDRVHFSLSHPEEIWEHRFQLGVLDDLLIWYYNNIYSCWKCVLFICKLENYKKDSLLIIFGGHFLGAHSASPLSFWVWMRHCFWMSFKTQSLSHQTWEIDRYKQLQ